MILAIVSRIVVVPLAGTWIETFMRPLAISSYLVVPLAGTWIETDKTLCYAYSSYGRSPCGNVD